MLDCFLHRQTCTAAGLLLFNCAGRLLEARARGRTRQLWEALAQAPAAGFSTYGEQWGPLQVSLTLTGLAFGELAVS